jgi:glucose-1-phosphate thymidylyltransferase
LDEDEIMKILIPMAGKGTRLRPHTLIKSKPLLKVAGKTMMQHLLDPFVKLDVTEVIFVVNPGQGDKIVDVVKKNYKFNARFVEQKIADGTAGAVLLAKEFITEDLIIVYADTLNDADLSIVKKVKKDNTVGGFIWAKEIEDYQRFGVVVTDKDGYITKIVEKPKEPISKLAAIGMYYIKDYKLLIEGIDYLYKNKITQSGEYFLTHALQYMMDRNAKLKVAPIVGWYDCGTLPALLDTNKILLKRMHTVDSKTINCVIIPPVFIDKNVVAENSILGPNVSIASGCVIKNCMLKDSIIDHDTKLTDVKLKDSTLGENVLLTSTSKKLHLGDYSEVHYD